MFKLYSIQEKMILIQLLNLYFSKREFETLFLSVVPKPKMFTQDTKLLS